MSKFIDIQNVYFEDYASRKISLNINGEPVRFQIPKLYMPFGLSGFEADYGPKKWNIDFALKGYMEDGQTKRFYEFLRNLEGAVITHVCNNSQQIFGRQMPYETVEAMFNSNIKLSNNGYEPKFRVKVDVDTDGHVKPKIFDSNEVEQSSEISEKLHSRQTGIAIVEVSNVYFMNKMFGLTWKLVQLKVFEPQNLKGFQFNT